MAGLLRFERASDSDSMMTGTDHVASNFLNNLLFISVQDKFKAVLFDNLI